MPIIEPFRALCYAPKLREDLDHLIAPPYDVIPEDRRALFASSHPRNIVHIDLPRDDGSNDVYRSAGRRLESWIQEQVLVRDQHPALYLCDQRFRTPAGEELSRRGFFARIRLEAFGSGGVLPHERTLDAPRVDRERLLSATRAHLSAVFLLHPDPDGRVSGLVDDALGGETFAEGRDAEGTISRVVRLDAPEAVAAIQGELRKSWVLIADGHHRYEASLNYRDHRRAGGHRDAESILAFFCSLADPGLRIFPIHRVVHSLSRFDAADFRSRLEPLFELNPVDRDEGLRASIRDGGDRPGVFGMLFKGESGAWVARWREGAGLERPLMAAMPEPLRRLDVILLHRLVLEEILGITTEAQALASHLDYVKDDHDLFRRMSDGAAQIGFLMNPTRMEQVIEVTRQGLRLPQKTTYFHPKVQTGLVLNPLDD